MSRLATTFAQALAQIALQVELRTRNLPAPAYLPKTFSSRVTLAGTSGQLVTTPDMDLRNSRFPFVVLGIHFLEVTTTPTAWRFEVLDRDMQAVIVGSPSRVSYEAAQNIDTTPLGGTQSTGLLLFDGGYEWSPSGGARISLESGGTANLVQVVVRGYWRLPGPQSASRRAPGLPPVPPDRSQPPRRWP